MTARDPVRLSEFDGSALQWDVMVAELGHPGSLLQSWAWGEVQSQSGWKVHRLVGGDQLACASMVLERRLRWGGGRMFYVPRGPATGEVGLQPVLDSVVAWAAARGAALVRCEPDLQAVDTPVLAPWRDGIAVQPQHTSIVELADDDRLLGGFKPKTRYNIGLALRRGVSVRGGEPEELSWLCALTARRNAIALPRADHFQRLLRAFGQRASILVAEYASEPLAALLMVWFDSRAYYLFGGSSGNRRELMPAYLLHLEAMRLARSMGCLDYDLWGVPPDGQADHPWHGLWQFKVGFNGRLVTYPPSRELCLRPTAWAADRAIGRLAGARRLMGHRSQS